MSKLSQVPKGATLKKLFGELKVHSGKLIIVAVCGLAMSGAQAFITFQVKSILDALQAGSASGIEKSGWIVLGVSAIMGVTRYLHFYYMNVTGEYVTQQLRSKLQRKFMRLSLTFHNNYATGSGGLISRILNDVLVVQNGLRLFADLFRAPFSFLFQLGLLFYLNWRLTLSILILLPLIAWFLKSVSRSVAKYSHRGFEGLERISSVIKESLDGMRVIQSFNLESEMESRFRHEFDSYLENRKKIHRRTESNGPITEFVATALMLGIVVYISLEIAKGKATFGDFGGYITAMLVLGQPIKTMQDAFIRVQETLVCASRIFSVLEEPSEVPQIAAPKDFPKNWQSVDFKNVTFSYGKGDVLKNLSFSIKNGEMVAFVGASGSGKSTIVNLLERYFDPGSGIIEIGGVNISEMSLHSLRQNIGLVTQEVFLFGDTVERNIWSGDFSKSRDRVSECAKMSNSYDFVSRLPEGFGTKMGERGNLFSGGEKQRISIARAMFKNAPIMILDEATSALDSKAEVEVQKGLDQLTEGRTSIVIAHRLSTIARSNRIFVMKEGEIVESGSHAELLAHKGEYYHLCQLQNLSRDGHEARTLQGTKS